MSLKDYFANTSGFGVLSTANSEGRVDAAVYARPHVINDGNVAFIMAERLTHANLQSNPHAAFLFREEGEGYRGKRLFLTKTGEEKDTKRLMQLRRRGACDEEPEGRHLVFFQVDEVLPLVGAGETIVSANA